MQNEITKETILAEISALDWGAFFKRNPQILLQTETSKAIESLLVYEQEKWKIALHWFVKLKFDPSHYKIPGKKTHRDLMKPHGELLKAQYELCLQMHSSLGENPPYPNGWIWFRAACVESQTHAIDTIFNLNTPTSGFSAKNKAALLKQSPKEAAHKPMLQVAQMMREGENPWENWRESDWAPAIGLLVETSLEVCKKAPKLEKEYWEPFTKAYSAWIRDRDRNPGWGVAHIQGGELKVSTGQGRGKRKIAAQKFLNSESLSA